MNNSEFSEEAITGLCRALFRIDAEMVRTLPGELDGNFQLRTRGGKIYVLKISRPETEPSSLELQNELLRFLMGRCPSLSLPRVIPNVEGKAISKMTDGANQERMVRLLSWIPGRLWAKVNPQSPELLESLGEALGTLNEGLRGFEHPAAHRFLKWDLSQAAWIKEHFHLIESEQKRELLMSFYEKYENEVLPLLPRLRRSVIYNDANDYNILVNDEKERSRVISLIDFGDVVYTNTVNDLAIGLAYALMGKADPLTAAASVVKGFHRNFPLKPDELQVLYPLVATRLIVSLINSAINRRAEPENEYLLISEAPAWELLEKWSRIPPALAHYTFRQAVGLEACPVRASFLSWVEKASRSFASLVGVDLRETPYRILDLSVGSLDLGNNDNFDCIPRFHRKIDGLLEERGVRIGLGGYGEVRPFYTTDAYQVQSDEGPRWRSVHLGLDIWMEAGTPVFSPLAATVHSVQNNEGERNYGPTLILEHRPEAGPVFYTLYGHLGSSCLRHWRKGMPVGRGQQVATIGAASENGNWPPHLHFQLMLDLLDMEGDFPGVAFPEQREIWLSICPDPALLMGLRVDSQRVSEMTPAGILAKRNRFLGRSLSLSYREPLKIVRAYGQYLYDHTARRYLDTVNNVPHVGHQHPQVVSAISRQLSVLNTNTRYLHEEIVHYAEELADTLPAPLSVVHFVNSGSEANELALRMARSWSGHKDMIVLEAGYHGNTCACVDISSYKFDGKGGQGAPGYVHKVPMPDTFRGAFRSDDPDAGKKYAAYVRDAVQKASEKGRGIAGFICESILSCGGQIVLPEAYLREAYQHIRAAGGLCIADEVQVGMGRVGDCYWGFELQGVVPDIVTMGKPIGNGHPLGAVVTSVEVAEAFANGMEYFNTFGGNPVSCAAGRAVLRIVEQEGLQVHAKEVGAYLSDGLKALKEKYPLIGDVRGPGLFLGMELICDPSSRKPAGEAAAYLANRMRRLGILMSTDGPFHNVIKIKPPMCFDRNNADFLLGMLDRVLGEDEMRRSGEQRRVSGS